LVVLLRGKRVTDMRVPKLRKKKVKGHRYWYTAANGGAYFGRVDEVTWDIAKEKFADHIKARQVEAVAPEVVTVGKLLAEFVAWVKAHRSAAQHDRRKRDCSRFARFRIGGRRIADMPALEVTGKMLEDWRENLKAKKPDRPAGEEAGDADENDRDKVGLDAQTLLHAEVSIRHAFNWGCKYPDPESYLPVTFRPFRGVERTHVDPKELKGEDLLPDAEVDAILDAATFDVDQFRRWGIELHIKKHGRTGMRACKDDFGDLIRVYHGTGARTSELALAKVGQFSARARQIVLGKHKRSKTTTKPTVRHINLSDEVLAILERRCEGRQPDEYIFMTAWKTRWTPKTLNTRLRSVARIARALGNPVRETTIYDFRHLWISDALMSGVDIITVAKMAGTSVKMIETVYGHFTTKHYEEAQRRLADARQGRRDTTAGKRPEEKMG
jgi:integrase